MMWRSIFFGGGVTIVALLAIGGCSVDVALQDLFEAL
jgi:hypothetical protein